MENNNINNNNNPDIDKPKKKKTNKAIEGNEILSELILKQLKTVSSEKKLQYSDLRRICKYLSCSIFDENNCCNWTGYVTNMNNITKGSYINFYFRKKKAALHRLLYSNFVGELEDDEYLKFTCENKGKCCNIRHLKKFRYQNIDEKVKKVLIGDYNEIEKLPPPPPKVVKPGKPIKILSVEEQEEKLHISFD